MLSSEHKGKDSVLGKDVIYSYRTANKMSAPGLPGIIVNLLEKVSLSSHGKSHTLTHTHMWALPYTHPERMMLKVLSDPNVIAQLWIKSPILIVQPVRHLVALIEWKQDFNEINSLEKKKVFPPSGGCCHFRTAQKLREGGTHSIPIVITQSASEWVMMIFWDNARGPTMPIDSNICFSSIRRNRWEDGRFVLKTCPWKSVPSPIIIISCFLHYGFASSLIWAITLC